jgi:NADP-dependent 3-hydroxy acid dehydrogenase YdfG
MTAPPTPDAPLHLIVGAAGGVGSALARQLAAAGARLALAGRDRARLDALAESLGPAAVHVAALDASRFDAVDQFVAAAAEAHGRSPGS